MWAAEQVAVAAGQHKREQGQGQGQGGGLKDEHTDFQIQRPLLSIVNPRQEQRQQHWTLPPVYGILMVT